MKEVKNSSKEELNQKRKKGITQKPRIKIKKNKPFGKLKRIKKSNGNNPFQREPTKLESSFLKWKLPTNNSLKPVPLKEGIWPSLNF